MEFVFSQLIGGRLLSRDLEDAGASIADDEHGDEELWPEDVERKRFSALQRKRDAAKG